MLVYSMRRGIYILSALLLFGFIACKSAPYPLDWFPPREVKPYDPEKAGAFIVQSFILSGNATVSSSDWASQLINGNYNLAEFSDCIYIRIGREMYIFDKKNIMAKKINIRFPDDSSYHIRGGGLVIADDDLAYFVCGLSIPRDSWRTYLLSIDLYTGYTQIVNEEALGFKSGLGNNPILGYNKADNLIWFNIEDAENNRYFYHFFQHDKNTFSFIPVGVKDGFFAGSGYLSRANGADMYGDESWIINYSTDVLSRQATSVRLDKININNPTEVLQCIDVEYLGTLSIPQSIIYDKPYIWILAEKENQVQMLKLLPN